MNDVINLPQALPKVVVTVQGQKVSVSHNLADQWQVVKILIMALNATIAQEDKKRQVAGANKVVVPAFVIPKGKLDG